MAEALLLVAFIVKGWTVKSNLEANMHAYGRQRIKGSKHITKKTLMKIRLYLFFLKLIV